MVINDPPPKSASAARIFQEISRQVKDITGPVLEDIRDLEQRHAMKGQLADVERSVAENYAMLRLIGGVQIATLVFVLGLYLVG